MKQYPRGLHLFYGGPFSQWAYSPMWIDGQFYPTAEHYMMAQKARLFMDGFALNKIMAAESPSEAKAWGRKVAKFNAARWAVVARDVVRTASVHKFSNLEYKAELWKTQGQLLVEASPTDTIWGIGLGEDDPRALDPKQWKGMNWLGQIITETRLHWWGE